LHHLLDENIFFPSVPDRIVGLGMAGVDIFFVISGFVMYYAEHDRANASGAASAFLVRRAIRIWPLFAILTVLMATLHFSGILFKSRDITLESFVKDLSFYPTMHTVLVVAWTLHYEVYFYILFGIALLVGSMKFLRIFLPLMLLLVLALSPAIPNEDARAFFANTIVLEFVLGMGIAHLYINAMVGRRASTIAFCLAAVGFVVALVIVGDDGIPNRTWRFVSWGVPSALLVYAMLAIEDVRGLAGKAGLFLGNASYSLYLTHSFVIVIAAKLRHITGLPDLVLASAALVISIGVAAATYVGLERPITNFLNEAWASYRLRRRAFS
jgi:exopolysaccharide production protein ExoZ